jgi:DNA-binding response OmpR family regulator
MRVLLVDDEQELVSALGERLCLRGIEAEWAISAEEALQRVETGTFDIAVLDIKMPGVNGLELMQQLEAKRPGMQYIFLTGYGSEKDFETVSHRCGEAAYLVKPIQIEDLIEKMNALMQCQRGEP